jgi:YbbR domain-containing protein
MKWLTDDWRLKLLALGLAFLMLGAVAFAQNPATTKTYTLPLHYNKPAAGMVLISPPPSINVTVSGPSDSLGNANPDNFFASVDTSHASPGPAVKFNVTVTPTASVFHVQTPAPVLVHVDSLKEVDLTVQVAATAAPGWVITAKASNPDTVHFIGPASWEDHLVAFVSGGTGVLGGQISQLNQPIQLQNSNGALFLEPCITVPCASLDLVAASITISTQTGSSTNTVPLVSPAPTHPPPGAYEVTGWSVSPITVTITADPATLGKVRFITLPAVDLSNSTSTVTFTVNIPYPNGVSPVGPKPVTTATVTYTIQKNPNVTASPSP